MKITARARQLLVELIDKSDAFEAAIDAYRDGGPTNPKAAFEMNQDKEIAKTELTATAIRLARVADGRPEDRFDERA